MTNEKLEMGNTLDRKIDTCKSIIDLLGKELSKLSNEKNDIAINFISYSEDGKSIIGNLEHNLSSQFYLQTFQDTKELGKEMKEIAHKKVIDALKESLKEYHKIYNDLIAEF